MHVAERERQLRWLMTLRVVIVTTLLICVFSIELLLRPELSLTPLFTLAAIAFGMVLLYAVVARWGAGTKTFAMLQLLGDASLITIFVGMTGGLDSPMSFLYLLPISVASMMLYRGGGVATALICWAQYGALVLWGPEYWPATANSVLAPRPEPDRVTYFLVAHLVGLVAVALLSSYLSERVRTQDRELDERRGTVARLQALNENIISSINSGLITTDLQGTINFMNRGGSEILQRSDREVEGGGAIHLFGLEDGFLTEIKRQLLARRRFRFEQWFTTASGRRIFLGIAASNLHDKTGHPLGFIFIFQDLTEIQALEDEVRLKERMAALGEMAAGMAHELRNPLASISGSVQYLKGDLRVEGEHLELMEIILRESERLDHAIRDFLTFAKPGAFSPAPTDLIKLVEDQLKLLGKSRELKREHRLTTSFDATSLECEVDANRVKQVFWNLATNALKAMPDGGHLTVSVRRPATGLVEMDFTDTGVGMDAESQASYFQPFNGSFREGTGLGAAIVYRLVEEHGGRIQVDSREGEGTTVSVMLPELQSHAPALSVAGGPQ
jgi:two-component system sensor histidine kinase PilS (NtrC family)